jgi:preprotein translocase subunit YajC
LLYGAVFIVFFLFFIRPNMQRQKKDKLFRESLQKGSRVATVSGIHGKVVSIEDGTVLLEVDEGVKLRFDKSAIGRSLDVVAPTSK